MNSIQLTYGRKKDGSPNAIVDGLSRTVCRFPEVSTSPYNGEDIRQGAPSTAETMEANARLFCASPELYGVLNAVRVAAKFGKPIDPLLPRIEEVLKKAESPAPHRPAPQGNPEAFFDVGYASGRKHWDPIPNTSEQAAERLRLDNLRKAGVGLRSETPEVNHYWQGYLAGMTEALNP